MQEQQLSRRQNSEQKRGKQAWEAIREVKRKDTSNEKKLEKEYRSRARSLNAMIQINGLGPTLGFLKAKGGGNENSAYYLLLSHLTSWMRDSDHFRAQNSSAMGERYDGLLNWLLDAGTSSDDYRRATTECLAFGAWLRRFAEAELKEPDLGEEQR
jgi:CRISPR-associated protein Cmr5